LPRTGSGLAAGARVGEAIAPGLTGAWLVGAPAEAAAGVFGPGWLPGAAGFGCVSAAECGGSTGCPVISWPLTRGLPFGSPGGAVPAGAGPAGAAAAGAGAGVAIG
jgi:hypothetical protein